jgi:hypothetical protein
MIVVRIRCDSIGGIIIVDYKNIAKYPCFGKP